MRLVPVNDSFKIECAAGEITLTRWEAIELAQLADQLQGQLQSLKDQHKPYPVAELSLKVGDDGNRKGGISWGCLTPPLLHQRSDMPCPKITSSS
jgi:hypothetical protein